MFRSRALLALACASLLALSCSSDSSDDDDAAAGGDDDETVLPAGHPVQGVTPTEIKIGVISSATIGPESHWQASYQRLKEEGRIPVHGRDIKLVYHALEGATAEASAENQRAACVKFATEERVFMAVGTTSPLAAECLSREQKLVFLGAAGTIPNDDLMERTAPFLFFNNMSTSRTLRNWPHWADDRGALEGKKLGLVRLDAPLNQAEVDRFFKPELEDLGYRLTEEVLYTDATSVPGMVQRLKASSVETVFMAAVGAHTAFALELEKQNYKPRVLMADYDSTGITASSPRDLPDTFAAEAVTAYHRASDGIPGNKPSPPEAVACADDYAKRFGRQLIELAGGKPSPTYNEFHILQHSCDIMNILVEALERAGPDLTPTALVNGLEETEDLKSGEVADISFTKTRHVGANRLKTIKWDPTCDCWKHESDFVDPYVD
jgi:hypothetical protein